MVMSRGLPVATNNVWSGFQAPAGPFIEATNGGEGRTEPCDAAGACAVVPRFAVGVVRIGVRRGCGARRSAVRYAACSDWGCRRTQALSGLLCKGL